MDEALNNYYWNQNEPAKSCLLAMQSIVREQDEHISESIKWGLPCFMYKNKIFCFFNVDKKTKEPYILFQEGDLLDFSELEQGDRKKMKIYKVNPTIDLPVETIKKLLNAALDLYRKGILATK